MGSVFLSHPHPPISLRCLETCCFDSIFMKSSFPNFFLWRGGGRCDLRMYPKTTHLYLPASTAVNNPVSCFRERTARSCSEARDRGYDKEVVLSLSLSLSLSRSLSLSISPPPPMVYSPGSWPCSTFLKSGFCFNFPLHSNGKLTETQAGLEGSKQAQEMVRVAFLHKIKSTTRDQAHHFLS